MNPPGWRRFPSAPSADPATLEALRGLATSLLSDNLQRASGTVGLSPFHRPRPMAGTAVTVRTRGGDNLAVHRAFDFCRPGDVLVIDGGGEVSQALVGEILARFAESLGVQGIVVDGAIRDVAAIRARDFPVYARGVIHRGPHKNGPGEINVPVAVGGMVVQPGDLVVGDEDGVLAIAPADVAAAIEAARRQGEQEAAALRAIEDGRFDRGWVEPHEKRMMGG